MGSTMQNITTVILQEIWPREFDTMQEEDFRIQKDMFIRIEDMKLLNVDDQNH